MHGAAVEEGGEGAERDVGVGLEVELPPAAVLVGDAAVGLGDERTRGGVEERGG